MTWKVAGDASLHGYQYSYDGLNRMSDATYGQGTSLNSNVDHFSEKVTGYDKNGNILGLKRYGQTGASSYGLIDDLSYSLNGNQLLSVNDAAGSSAYNNSFEFTDGAKTTLEYAYDANGNLTKDLNKSISLIQYNYLNLPSSITFSDGSVITYTYSADGGKLRTVHQLGTAVTTRDYCGNVVYENGTAKQLLTDEGYVSLSDNKYHYYLKDHQGNNRVVINQTGVVEETNHYYPFGGVFASTGNVQPYKYNGKELDIQKGLNLYDYGARHYDAALGRFTTNDPLAEKYYSMSSYGYCLSNPVNYVDPNGKDVYGFDSNTGQLTLIERTQDEFDRIRIGSFGKENYFTTFNESQYLDISKGTLLGEYFDNISEFGIVFHEGFLSEGIRTMEFLSFNSNIEFSAWAYTSSQGIGLSISPWVLNGMDKREGKTYMQSKDFYIHGDRVGYMGDKYFNIHTHPATKQGLGGYGKPSNTDFRNIQLNNQYPHYILSKKDGIIRYFPNKTWEKSFIK